MQASSVSFDGKNEELACCLNCSVVDTHSALLSVHTVSLRNYRYADCGKNIIYTVSQKNRTPVTFSNNSNNPGSISTNFGTKNRQLIGT